MPRIRTLKPEHRTHRKIGPLSHLTYRLWVGMLLEADDEGRLVCDSEQLRVTVFGYHASVRRAFVERSIKELETVGLIQVYQQGVVQYACFPSWHDHQKIDRKQPSKLPACEDSSSVRRAFVEDSSSVRHGSDLDLDLDRKGSHKTFEDSSSVRHRSDLDLDRKGSHKTFEAFWQAYPKKIGIDDARRVWAQKHPPLDQVLAALEVQARSPAWLKEGGQFIPGPAKWLRGGHWQNEVPQLPLDDEDAE